MTVQTKRLYAPRAPDEGTRVLVDRLWPRGIARGTDRFDHWLRGLGPSDALRAWFGHEPSRWEEFQRRYYDELSASGEDMQTLLALLDEGPVTLVYSARDEAHNQAVALKAFLEAQASG